MYTWKYLHGNIAMKVSGRHPLVFCTVLQYRNIRHEILFHVLYNGTVIISRKQADDAPILSSRYFEATQCSDTFTKSNGEKVSRYKCAQIWIYLEWVNLCAHLLKTFLFDSMSGIKTIRCKIKYFYLICEHAGINTDRHQVTLSI